MAFIIKVFSLNIFLQVTKSPNTSLFHTASRQINENRIRIDEYTVIHPYTVLSTFEIN